ncbi:MAG: MBL fold metallo-hydrolase [Burkholderiales bacterium]|nr:MBL fold metallo-hydrolase [Burkholderiales bacterium]
MLLRQLFDIETFTFTYIIAADFGKEAIIIDPVESKVDKYVNLLNELGLTLKYVFDTHVHADHITASGKLRDKTGCITLIGQETGAACVSKTVKDNEKLIINGLEFTVLRTPGHTQDSYCLYTSGMVFTGDTLFIRGTGRTDFQAGSPVDQYYSIVNKLFTLPEATIVYPGHDYNGNSSSTIWEEKRFNPRLAGKTVEEFKVIMDNLNLPSPKLMDVAVPANLKCGLI